MLLAERWVPDGEDGVERVDLAPCAGWVTSAWVQFGVFFFNVS